MRGALVQRASPTYRVAVLGLPEGAGLTNPKREALLVQSVGIRGGSLVDSLLFRLGLR